MINLRESPFLLVECVSVFLHSVLHSSYTYLAQKLHLMNTLWTIIPPKLSCQASLLAYLLLGGVG